MFVFAFLVPGLLVVVLGYVVGHAAWGVIGGGIDAAFGTSLVPGTSEPAGWITGFVLLAVVVRVLVGALRRRRRPPGTDQK